MYRDDALLDAIARQARIAYATLRLRECQDALALLQQPDERCTAAQPARDLALVIDYQREIARWEAYLRELEMSEARARGRDVSVA